MIICNFNLFDIEQKILLADPETGEFSVFAVSNFDDLGTNIAKACQKAESYNVHLYGTTDYLEEKVIPQLKEYLSLTYGLEDLNVEVN